MLFGYVRTKLKIGATNILAVPPEYDPLLAYWECGEGRAAVFSSDVKDKWGVLWLREWGRNFDTFWNGVVLGVARRSQNDKAGPAPQRQRPERASQRRSARLPGAVHQRQRRALRNLLSRRAGLSVHAQQHGTVPARCRRPGTRYTGSHRIHSKGLYAVKFRGPEHGQIVSTGIVVSNFREYLTLGPDKKFLKDLCDAGGGSLDAESAVTASPLAGKQRETMTDIGHWALLAACILFLGDVAARRWPAFCARLRGRNKS